MLIKKFILFLMLCVLTMFFCSGCEKNESEMSSEVSNSKEAIETYGFGDEALEDSPKTSQEDSYEEEYEYDQNLSSDYDNVEIVESNPSYEQENSEENETQSSTIDTKNTLIANIDGEEHVFYLKEADQERYPSGRKIAFHFKELNPRGEGISYINIYFPSAWGEGEYDIYRCHDVGYKKSNVSIDYMREGEKGIYKAPYDDGKDEEIVGQFEIDEMSSDWMTFYGTISVELKKDEGDCIYIDGEYNATLGDQHSYFDY